MYYLMVFQVKNKLTRKERDYIRHKAEIMKSAEELFAKAGYNNVTMDMIAKESEYCKGSLYNYFESKDILFFEILNSKTKLFMVELIKVVSESLTFVDKINALVEYYFDFFSENIGFFKIAHTEKYNIANFTKKRMMISLRQRYFDHMEGIKSIVRLKSKKSEEELNLIATTIVGILNGLVAGNVIYDEKIDLEKVKSFAKGKILKLIE